MLYWICKYKNHSSRWDGFIMYHQVNELILKWYFGKCAKFHCENIQTDFFTED
jgi:hypothetical protein